MWFRRIEVWRCAAGVGTSRYGALEACCRCSRDVEEFAWCGVIPTSVIGHSLGEYAALHVAGVLSASDMILLVGRRAQLLEKDCTKYTHGMLAVKSSVEDLETLLGD